MGVDLDADVHGIAQARDRFVGGERVKHAQGVGKAHALRATGRGQARHFGHEERVGARSVFHAKGKFAPALGGAAEHARHFADDPGA